MAIDQSQVETLIANFQERQQLIEQHEDETRNRLALVECYMPSILAWNVWRALEAKQLQTRAQKLEAENNRLCDRVELLDNEKKKAQDSSGISRTPDDEAISLSVETCRDRIKEGGSPIITADVTRVGQNAGMATVLLKPDAINNVANEISNQPMTPSHTGLFAPENELSLLPATGALSESASPEEVERIRQLQQMAANEMETKKRIEQMERRENVYMEALQRAEELCTLVNIPSDGDIIVALQILIPQLESENRRLRDLEFTLEGQLKRLNIPIPQKIQEIQGDAAKYVGDVAPAAQPKTAPAPVSDEAFEGVEVTVEEVQLVDTGASGQPEDSGLGLEPGDAGETPQADETEESPQPQDAEGTAQQAEEEIPQTAISTPQPQSQQMSREQSGACQSPLAQLAEETANIASKTARKASRMPETGDLADDAADIARQAQELADKIADLGLAVRAASDDEHSLHYAPIYIGDQVVEEDYSENEFTDADFKEIPHEEDAGEAIEATDEIAEVETVDVPAESDEGPAEEEAAIVTELSDEPTVEDSAGTADRVSAEVVEAADSEAPEVTEEPEAPEEGEVIAEPEAPEEGEVIAEPEVEVSVEPEAAEEPQEKPEAEVVEEGEVIDEPVEEEIFEEAEDTIPVPEELIEAAESGKPMSEVDYESLSELTKMVQETAEMATKTAEFASKKAEEASTAGFAPSAKVAKDIADLATELAKKATNLENIIQSGGEGVDLDESPWPTEDQIALVQMAQETAEMASKTAEEASKIAEVADNAVEIAKIALDLATKAAELSTSAKVIREAGEDEGSLHLEPIVVEDQVVEEDYSENEFTDADFKEIPHEEGAGEGIEATDEVGEVETVEVSGEDEGSLHLEPIVVEDQVVEEDYSENEFTDADFKEIPHNEDAGEAIEATDEVAEVETVEVPAESNEGPAEEGPGDEAAPGEEVVVEGEPTLAEMAALTATAASQTAYEAAQMVEKLKDQATPENADVLDHAISMARLAADIAKQASALADKAADHENAEVEAAAAPVEGEEVKQGLAVGCADIPPLPKFPPIPKDLSPLDELAEISKHLHLVFDHIQKCPSCREAVGDSVDAFVSKLDSMTAVLTNNCPAAAAAGPSEGPVVSKQPAGPPDVSGPSEGPPPAEEPAVAPDVSVPSEGPEAAEEPAAAPDVCAPSVGPVEEPVTTCFDDAPFQMPDPDDSFLLFETTYSRTTADDFNFGPIGSCVLEPAKPFGFTDSQLAVAFEEEVVEPVELGSHEQLFQDVFPDIAAAVAVQQEAKLAEMVTSPTIPEAAEISEEKPVAAEPVEEVVKPEPQMPDAAQQFPEYMVTSDSNLADLILAMSKMASKTAEEAEKLKQIAAAEPGTIDPVLIQEVADEAADLARKAAELQQRTKELDLTAMPPGAMEVTLSFLKGEPIQIPGPEDSFLAFESTYSRTTAEDFDFGPTGSCVLEPAKPFGFTDSQLAVAFEEEVIEPVELGSHEQLFENVFPGIVTTIAALEEARLAALQQQQFGDGTTAAVPEVVSETAEEPPAETEAAPEETTEPTEEAPVEAEVTETGPDEAVEPTDEVPAETEVVEAEPEVVEPTEEAAEVLEVGQEEVVEPTEEEPAEAVVTEAGPEEAAEPTEEQAAPEGTEAGPEEAAEPTEEQAAPEAIEAKPEKESEPVEEVLPETEVDELEPEDTGTSEAPGEVVEQVLDFAEEAEASTSQQPEREPQPIIEKVTEDEALNDLLVSLQQRALSKSNEIIEIKKLLGDLDRQQKNLMATLGQAGPSAGMPMPSTGMPAPVSMPVIGDDSGIIATIAALQEKCRLKDHLIGVMVDELRTRTQSGVWENLLTNIAAPGSPQPDFTRTDVSERLRTGADKPPAPKLPCDCSSNKNAQECPGAPNIPTFPRGGPTIGVPMPPETSDAQCICPTDFRIIRQIGFDSLLLSWKACPTPIVVGYEIYVNGTLAHKVRSNTRDRALLQCLDISTDLDIKLFARINTGQLTGGAQITYTAQR